MNLGSSPKRVEREHAPAPLESALLLACARTWMLPEHHAHVEALVGTGLDWDRVVRLSGRHKVLPLLYRNLSAIRSGRFPAEAMTRLRGAFELNCSRNLLLAGELLRVLTCLEAADVRTVAYRGPVLAKRAYGDVTLRQFNDLDLLVRNRDVDQARALVLSLGYKQKVPHGVAPSVHAKSMHHLVFAREAGRVLLELHWEIAPRYFGYAIDEGLWGRLTSVELGGVPVPALSGEDLLVVLCVHAALHGWQRLSWICDVAEVVRSQPQLDWPLAMRLGQQQGVSRVLLLGLYLAHDLLGAAIPEESWALVRGDAAVEPLAGQAKRWLFPAEEVPRGPTPRYSLFGFHLGLQETLGQKVAHGLRMAFVPSQEDWALVRLPPRLSFLYGLVRPLRLVAKHGVRWIARPR